MGLTGGAAPVTPAIKHALMKLPNLRCLINVSEIDVEIQNYGLTEGLLLASECDPGSPIVVKYEGN